MSTGMNEVRLYLDYTCPWSYLALVRLRDVADRNGAQISLRPVVVDKILATENPALQASRLEPNPAKAAWQQKDLQDWARMWGLQINLPANWPVDASLAAAGAVVADKNNQGKSDQGIEYSLNVYRAYFGRAEDISNAAVLTRCAVDAGLSESEFSGALAHTEAQQQVGVWNDELIRLGGFGTPSMVVEDELFFGNDRMPLVDWRLSPMGAGDFVAPGQHG
jgi:2-hydroxychromene-2-carboxylate isomerase